jgi:hypothetical protein
MRRLDFGIAAFGAALALSAAAWFVPSSHAQPTIITPTISAGSLAAGTVATTLAIPNPTRHSIRICNTGSSNVVWIWPNNSSTCIGVTPVSGYVIAPIASNVIACYTPPTGIVGTSAGGVTGPTTGYCGNSILATTVSVEEW